MSDSGSAQEGRPAAAAPPAVEIRGVRLQRGGASILDGIDLTVPVGQFLGMIGPNGGGKSTLVRILVGLETADAGLVRVLGLPPGASREIGYLPQSPHYDDRFPIRVRDVVGLGLPKGAGREGARRVDEVLADLGLDALAARPVGVLSGGERQRMFLARALARRPRLLLLDEPTLGVDVHALDAFLHLLMKIRQERELTILMVTHDFGVITSHADRVVCLAGRIAFHGLPSQLDESCLTEAFGVHNLFLEHRH